MNEAVDRDSVVWWIVIYVTSNRQLQRKAMDLYGQRIR